MSDPVFTPEADRHLLAVYRREDRAIAAQRLLTTAGGVSPDAVHLDDRLDHVAALRAEMHQELADAWVVPNAGIAYPKEAARGLVALTAFGVVFGVLLAFPLAFLDLGSTYWVRWVAFAIVGAAFGITVALVAGPAMGARRPSQAAAAVEGATVRVEHDSQELRDLLASLDPIRIDELTADGDPIAAVMTEGADTGATGMRETVEDLAANVGGDDYHPRRG